MSSEGVDFFPTETRALNSKGKRPSKSEVFPTFSSPTTINLVRNRETGAELPLFKSMTYLIKSEVDFSRISFGNENCPKSAGVSNMRGSILQSKGDK